MGTSDPRKVTVIKRTPAQARSALVKAMLARGQGPRNLNIRMADPHYQAPVPKTRQEQLKSKMASTLPINGGSIPRNQKLNGGKR